MAEWRDSSNDWSIGGRGDWFGERWLKHNLVIRSAATDLDVEQLETMIAKFVPVVLGV